MLLQQELELVQELVRELVRELELVPEPVPELELVLELVQELEPTPDMEPTSNLMYKLCLLDTFWTKGPFMGHILSTGITARSGLIITQDSVGPQNTDVGTRYWEKRLPSYIPLF